jgi:hypothetical protein
MRQLTLSTTDYPTEAKARIALQERVLAINGPDSYRAHDEPTMGLLIDRFIVEEKLLEIIQQRPGDVTVDGLAFSTATSYLSYFKRHIKPKWEHVQLRDLKALDIKSWLQGLTLAPKT